MTPADFVKTAHKIYGRKKWKPQLARDLGVDVSTIHRIVKRDQIPGPYEVALRGLMAHRQQEIVLEKAARKLVPTRLRKMLRRDKGKARKRQLAPRKPKANPQIETGRDDAKIIE